MNQDKVLQKLIEHDERLEKIDNRLEKTLTRDEFHTSMDRIIKILERVDQERVFTTEWIRRMEGDLERVKEKLGIR